MRARQRPHRKHPDAGRTARASRAAGASTAAPGKTALAAGLMLALLTGCGTQTGPDEAPPLLTSGEIAALDIPDEAPMIERPPGIPTAMDRLRPAADPGQAEMDARAAALRARAATLRQQDAAQRDAVSDLRARADALRRDASDCGTDPDCAPVNEDR